jgi:hypothetical protein
VSPESREIFVWNKDRSTGIAALFRAFWTPFPRKKIREDGARDLCGVALKQMRSVLSGGALCKRHIAVI